MARGGEQATWKLGRRVAAWTGLALAAGFFLLQVGAGLRAENLAGVVVGAVALVLLAVAAATTVAGGPPRRRARDDQRAHGEDRKSGG